MHEHEFKQVVHAERFGEKDRCITLYRKCDCGCIDRSVFLITHEEGEKIKD